MATSIRQNSGVAFIWNCCKSFAWSVNNQQLHLHVTRVCSLHSNTFALSKRAWLDPNSSNDERKQRKYEYTKNTGKPKAFWVTVKMFPHLAWVLLLPFAFDLCFRGQWALSATVIVCLWLMHREREHLFLQSSSRMSFPESPCDEPEESDVGWQWCNERSKLDPNLAVSCPPAT